MMRKSIRPLTINCTAKDAKQLLHNQGTPIGPVPVETMRDQEHTKVDSCNNEHHNDKYSYLKQPLYLCGEHRKRNDTDWIEQQGNGQGII